MGDSGSHYTETYSQENASKPPSTGDSVTSTDKGLGTTASMTEELEESNTQPGSPTRKKKREEKLKAKYDAVMSSYKNWGAFSWDQFSDTYLSPCKSELFT